MRIPSDDESRVHQTGLEASEEYQEFLKKHEGPNKEYEENLRLSHELDQFTKRIAKWTGTISGALTSALVGGWFFQPSFEALLDTPSGWKRWAYLLASIGVGALVGLVVGATASFRNAYCDLIRLHARARECKLCDQVMAKVVREQREAEEFVRESSGQYPPGEPWRKIFD